MTMRPTGGSGRVICAHVRGAGMAARTRAGNAPPNSARRAATSMNEADGSRTRAASSDMVSAAQAHLSIRQARAHMSARAGTRSLIEEAHLYVHATLVDGRRIVAVRR